MIYDGRQNWDIDEEYQSRIADQQERDLARRCGMNAFEASHYTPAQMQAALRRPGAQETPESFEGRWVIFKGNIWNAHADICPAHLQAEFTIDKKYFLQAN